MSQIFVVVELGLPEFDILDEFVISVFVRKNIFRFKFFIFLINLCMVEFSKFISLIEIIANFVGLVKTI